MWFGLTGRNASGKTTVVDWLVDNGYVATSCSDSIRAYLKAQGKEIHRENLIAGGRELRAAHGPAILAEMLRDTNSNVENLVIDSIRTPAEVEALRERPDFRLIEVQASREVRWSRLQSRAEMEILPIGRPLSPKRKPNLWRRMKVDKHLMQPQHWQI